MSTGSSSTAWPTCRAAWPAPPPSRSPTPPSPTRSKLANLGYKAALKADPALAKGLNVLEGKLVCKAVAEGVGMEYTPCEYLAEL